MQNGGALEKFGLKVEYVNPKNRKVPTANIVSAMAQTLKRRVEKSEWVEYLNSVELVIVDEAHTCDADPVLDYLSEKCFVLGVTATPRRSARMKQLGSMYRAMVTGVTVKELIQMGFLSPSRHYAVTAPKLDIPIDRSIGDYNQKALAQKFESKTLYRGVVDEWLRLTPNKKTICFCVSSKQAVAITKEFVERGVSAKYVLSNAQEEDAEYSGDRKDVMSAFARSEFTVLVNVGVAVAGLDVPDIEVVIANFATVSMTKWRQSIGRGARVCEGKKEFVILDCGGNYQRLGMYEDEVAWCLWHNTGGDGLQPLKECDPKKKDINGKYGCGQLIPMTAKVCPACGFVFPTEKHIYEMHLEEVVRGIDDVENMTIEQYCADKVQRGWKANRILIQCLLRNPKDEKKAFERANAVVRTNWRWRYFKERIWDKVREKQVVAREQEKKDAVELRFFE